MLLSTGQRIALWILAVTSFVTAILLLMWSGLPNRAEYSGFVIDNVYVAPEVGQIAPPFQSELLSGSTIQLDDFHGEWVVINFWATWCVPCAVEMPELQVLHEESDIQILGINIGENRNTIQAWVNEFQLTFGIVLDPQQDIYQTYRVRGQPSTYIIRPDGIISHVFFGPTTASAIQAAIDNTSG